MGDRAHDWYECKWTFYEYVPMLQSLRWFCQWSMAASDDPFHPLYFPERHEDLRAEIGDRYALIDLKPGLVEYASSSPSPQIVLSDQSVVRWPNHRWRVLIESVREGYCKVIELQNSADTWVNALRPYWEEEGKALFESWGYRALLELHSVRAMIGGAQHAVEYGPVPTFQPGDELLSDPMRYGEFYGEPGERAVSQIEKLRDEVDVALDLIIRDGHDRLLREAKRARAETRDKESREDGRSDSEAVTLRKSMDVATAQVKAEAIVRQEGFPKSRNALAKRVGCSRATIKKAIEGGQSISKSGILKVAEQRRKAGDLTVRQKDAKLDDPAVELDLLIAEQAADAKRDQLE